MSSYCKAHPDEKGIETIVYLVPPEKMSFYCKAHPDEKGIETGYGSCVYVQEIDDHCKAHPDEKGIETRHPASR